MEVKQITERIKGDNPCKEICTVVGSQKCSTPLGTWCFYCSTLLWNKNWLQFACETDWDLFIDNNHIDQESGNLSLLPSAPGFVAHPVTSFYQVIKKIYQKYLAANESFWLSWHKRWIHFWLVSQVMPAFSHPSKTDLWLKTCTFLCV